MNKLDQQKGKVNVTIVNRHNETLSWHIQITDWQLCMFIVYEPIRYFSMTQSSCLLIIHSPFVPLSPTLMANSTEVFSQ